MILVTVTWDEVTPESAEKGDFSNSGFLFEDEPLSFRELVDMIRAYGYFEDTGHGTLRFPDAEIDYRTATHTSFALHFSHLNPDRLRKWFDLASRVANRTAKKGTP